MDSKFLFSVLFYNTYGQGLAHIFYIASVLHFNILKVSPVCACQHYKIWWRNIKVDNKTVLWVKNNWATIALIWRKLGTWSNVFEFNSNIEQQICKPAKCALTYACLFMDELEQVFLQTQDYQSFLWLRYIGDIFFIWTHAELSQVKETFHL